MTFAPECCWPFEANASFWAILENFFFVSPLHFFRKWGFWVTFQKIAITLPFGHFGSRCLCQNHLQSLRFKSILIGGSCHLGQSAFGPFKRGLLFGRFLKNFPWSPLSTFSENAGLGWPCKNCHNLAIRVLLEPLFAPKFFEVVAL